MLYSVSGLSCLFGAALILVSPLPGPSEKAEINIVDTSKKSKESKKSGIKESKVSEEETQTTTLWAQLTSAKILGLIAANLLTYIARSGSLDWSALYFYELFASDSTALNSIQLSMSAGALVPSTPSFFA